LLVELALRLIDAITANAVNAFGIDLLSQSYLIAIDPSLAQRLGDAIEPALVNAPFTLLFKEGVYEASRVFSALD
jgi:hypothetical protein